MITNAKDAKRLVLEDMEPIYKEIEFYAKNRKTSAEFGDLSDFQRAQLEIAGFKIKKYKACDLQDYCIVSWE